MRVRSSFVSARGFRSGARLERDASLLLDDECLFCASLAFRSSLAFWAYQVFCFPCVISYKKQATNRKEASERNMNALNPGRVLTASSHPSWTVVKSSQVYTTTDNQTEAYRTECAPEASSGGREWAEMTEGSLGSRPRSSPC